MEDLYNETVERHGKIYHYDPDHDIYCCRSTAVSGFDRYGWIVMTAVLAAIALYFEFYPIR